MSPWNVPARPKGRESRAPPASPDRLEHISKGAQWRNRALSRSTSGLVRAGRVTRAREVHYPWRAQTNGAPRRAYKNRPSDERPQEDHDAADLEPAVAYCLP